jgi:hypothetical protein
MWKTRDYFNELSLDRNPCTAQFPLSTLSQAYTHRHDPRDVQPLYNYLLTKIDITAGYRSNARGYPGPNPQAELTVDILFPRR